MKKVYLTLLVMLFSSQSSASILEGTLWYDVAKAHNLEPELLYAVALVESGVARTKVSVSPWPFALRVKSYNYYGEDKAKTKAVLADFITEHGNNVDVGVGQINLHWHGHRVDKPEDLLDLETNLNVMADILSETAKSSDDIELQVGRYHSWRNERARSYARKVLAIREKLVK